MITTDAITFGLTINIPEQIASGLLQSGHTTLIAEFGMKTTHAFLAFAVISTSALAVSSPVIAAPVLDGSGFGAPSSTVAYVPGTAESNFGAPGPTTDGAAYNIYARGDATYAYFLIAQNGAGGSSPGTFANLYFGTGASAMLGSDLGFEVTNNDVFIPGGAGPFSTAGTGIANAILLGGTAIEFAVPFSYFETDPQNLGFDRTTAANPDIILRLSQSFGYSVAGGASYGPTRLALVVDPISGATAVPEPASMALLGMGVLGLGLTRRKRS